MYLRDGGQRPGTRPGLRPQKRWGGALSEAEEDSKRQREEKEALRGCGGCLALIAGVLVLGYFVGSDAIGDTEARRTIEAREGIRPTAPAPQPPARLGISRDSIVGLFRAVEIEMDFENSPLASGEPRTLGLAEHMLVEIIGTPGDVTEATLSFGQTTDPVQAIEIAAAVGILGIAIGDDPNNLLEWFGETAPTMVAGDSRTYRRNGNRATLKASVTGLYMLTVEPDGP